MSLEPGGRMSQNYEFGSGNVYRENVQEKKYRKKYSEIIKLYHRLHPVYPELLFAFYFPLFNIDLDFSFDLELNQSQADGSTIRPDTHRPYY